MDPQLSMLMAMLRELSPEELRVALHSMVAAVGNGPIESVIPATPPPAHLASERPPSPHVRH